MQITKRSATLALAIMGLAAAAPAGAQTTVSGSTFGCFGAGCNPVGSASATYAIGTTGASILFTGASFSGTTNPTTNGFSVGSFGSFVLNGVTATTPNTNFTTPFTLLFALTAPGGASTPASTFTVNGFVGNTGGQPSRDVSYTGGSTNFTFTGGSGVITYNGDNIGFSPNNIGGRISATAASTVPEPSTYALLATGFVGLAGAVVRRRNANA